MFKFLPFLSAVIPSFLLVWYFYKKDPNPEPKNLILRTFLFGIFSTLPVLIIGYALWGRMEMFFYNIHPVAHLAFIAFVVAGFTEEFVKFIVVKWTCYDNRQFNQIMDGIIYTIVASLGFACMENVIYVSSGGWQTAIARAFTAVPFHAVVSGTMGFYIGRAKFEKEKERGLLVKGLVYATLLHGFYDFFLFISPLYGSLFSILIVPIILITFKKLERKIKIAGKKDRDSDR